MSSELCQCRHCAEQVHKANASVLCVSFLVDGSLLNKPSSKCRFSPNVRRLTTTFGQSEVYTEQVAGRQGHKILTWQNNSEKDLVMREATYLANGKKIVE
uniref:Uncharacterized protein n=1 Tax=Daucus carota subsp. sativus TaxID=79200 RepID=A0A162ALR6_DAUCS